MLEETTFVEENELLDFKIKGKIRKIVVYLENLQFKDKPDYDSIRSILTKCMKFSTMF